MQCPLGRETTYGYDELGRETRRTYPDGLSETKAYDLAGQLAQKTRPSGSTTTYAYDAEDRLVRRDGSDGVFADLGYSATGQRTRATDDRGNTLSTYDNRDRLASFTMPEGHSLTYAYDDSGRLVARTANAEGETWTESFTYDGAGRIATVTDGDGQVFTMTYDAAGQLETTTLPNGMVEYRLYDDNGRLVELTTDDGGVAVTSFRYTLDDVGNPVLQEELEGVVRTYAYDDADRLLLESVTDPDGLVYEIEYVYDAAGNRVSQIERDADGVEVLPYAVDVRDRIVSCGSTSFAWDDDGRLVVRSGSDGYELAWNSEDRLLSIEHADGQVLENAYDVDGTRVSFSMDGSSTELVTDKSGLLSHVVGDVFGGAVTARYTRRHDTLLGSDAFGLVLGDRVGTNRVEVGGGGVLERELTAFGIERSSYVGSRYSFAGQPRHDGGLAYHRARWGDQSTGRFLSEDPFRGLTALHKTLHAYGYAESRPIVGRDPSGLFTLIESQTALAIHASLAALASTVLIQGYAQAVAAGTVAPPSFEVRLESPSYDRLLQWVQSSSKGLIRRFRSPGPCKALAKSLGRVCRGLAIVAPQRFAREFGVETLTTEGAQEICAEFERLMEAWCNDKEPPALPTVPDRKLLPAPGRGTSTSTTVPGGGI